MLSVPMKALPVTVRLWRGVIGSFEQVNTRLIVRNSCFLTFQQGGITLNIPGKATSKQEELRLWRGVIGSFEQVNTRLIVRNSCFLTFQQGGITLNIPGKATSKQEEY